MTSTAAIGASKRYVPAFSARAAPVRQSAARNVASFWIDAAGNQLLADRARAAARRNLHELLGGAVSAVRLAGALVKRDADTRAANQRQDDKNEK